MKITGESRVSVPPDTLINIIGGESVLLDLKSERYFGLDDIGTRMWTVLTTSPSVQAAFEVLLAEYEVDPDVLQGDLHGLLEKLLGHGLLDLSSE
jgi:hypothetical protein